MKKLLILVIPLLLACSSQPGPKDVVFEFIDGVLTSDSLIVVKNLDIDAYIKSLMMEMSPADSSAILSEKRVSTIQTLLGDGETRRRWLRSQIIVNTETKSDSVAEVEVSFIDRSINHQLYTKMQLKRQVDKSWKIVFFK